MSEHEWHRAFLDEMCVQCCILRTHPEATGSCSRDPLAPITTRKDFPVASGCLDYFPLAIREVARVSKVGNEQHSPGAPLAWSRAKSSDHPDCLMRHFLERGTIDEDGMRHTAKVAWRALALLQLELEAEASKASK